MATSTVKSTGGDYSSLSAWHTALPATLTEAEIAECDAFEDTTAVTLSKVSSAANYMEARAASGHQHDFTRGTGYRLVVTSGSALAIAHNYIRLKGLAFKSTASGQDGVNAMSSAISATSDIRIEQCYAYDCANDGFRLGSGTIKLVNSCDVGAGRQGWSADFGSGGALTLHVYNHTSGSSGCRKFTGTVHLKNSYVRAIAIGGGALSSDTTNASADGSVGTTVAFNTTNFTNVTSGSEDLMLPGTAGALDDAGTDLSADAGYAFSVDGFGNTRSGTWDIGFHEYGATAGAINLVIAEASHGHAADNLALTQAHVLAILDAAHAHAADVLALTQSHVLVVSDALHAHLADNLALTIGAVVTPDGRVIVIPFEDRTVLVVAESREIAIAREDRTITIH